MEKAKTLEAEANKAAREWFEDSTGPDLIVSLANLIADFARAEAEEATASAYEDSRQIVLNHALCNSSLKTAASAIAIRARAYKENK